MPQSSVETDLPKGGAPGWADAPPARTNGRGLLPSTWLGRSVRLAYTAVDGQPVETSAILADWYAFGAAFYLAGGKVLVSWDAIHSMELRDG